MAGWRLLTVSWHPHWQLAIFLALSPFTNIFFSCPLRLYIFSASPAAKRRARRKEGEGGGRAREMMAIGNVCVEKAMAGGSSRNTFRFLLHLRCVLPVNKPLARIRAAKKVVHRFAAVHAKRRRTLAECKRVPAIRHGFCSFASFHAWMATSISWQQKRTTGLGIGWHKLMPAFACRCLLLCFAWPLNASSKKSL